MEVWNDFQTGRYFSLDPTTGLHHLSNKFGHSHEKFIPYKAGYFRDITPQSHPANPPLSLQPRKFNGYSQFPRPFQTSIASGSQIPSKFSSPRIRLLEKKIPQPLSYLRISPQKDFSASPLRQRRKNSSSDKNFLVCSIEDLRKLDFPRAISVIRTKVELEKKMKTERFEYRKRIGREKQMTERKKLKGFFMSKFKDSKDLIRIEKEIVEKTNPVLTMRNLKMKVLDFKRLERKREATRLMVAMNS